LYRTGPLVAVICAALALASCGGGGTAGDASTAPAGSATVAAGAHPGGPGSPTKPGPSGATGASGTSGASAKSAGAAACQARLADFLARMADLRQSLLAGLSYDEYVVRVQAIRAAYDAIPVDKLGIACVTGAATHAEDAFNQYLRAANAWGECAATAGCAASEVEAKLQRRWHLAAKSLAAAERREG